MAASVAGCSACPRSPGLAPERHRERSIGVYGEQRAHQYRSPPSLRKTPGSAPELPYAVPSLTGRAFQRAP